MQSDGRICLNSTNNSLNIGFCRLADDPILFLSDAELGKTSSALSPIQIRLERIKYLKQNGFSQGYKPFSVSVESLKAHCYIGAGSGHGKSELIKRLAYGLMQQGYGVIILDPHGELALQVAKWQEFSQDPDRLIYFAPKLADKKFSKAPVINPLAALYQADDLDSVVENFMSVMVAVVGGGNAELSNRMKIILKPCLYTLANHKNATIYDIFEFLDDDEKAKDWVKKARENLTNRALLDTLNIFFDDSYKLTKSSVRDRLRALLSSDGLDKCLAGGESSIDLKSAMDSGKVMVFNLAGMGQESCGAFGRFIVGTVQNIAMQRYELASHERKPVFMFLDEADRFISDAVVDIYKETRKYGLHLAIVQQTTGYKMSYETYRAIISNSCVRFSGNAGGDSQTLKDLAKNTGTTESDIRSLPKLFFVSQEMQKKPKRFGLLHETKGKKRGAELLGNNHSMSDDEWQKVKAFQIDRYYIPTKPLEETKTTSTLEDTQTTLLENVKDTSSEPLDFYGLN